jgi:LPXTG-motif cell wall-anchored protein
MALATVSAGQTSSTSSRTTAFEVLAVDGNHLVVRTPSGTKEHQVPEDFRFTVDGQQLSVHQLKPGMKGTATITTTVTTKPVSVTEVRNGVVMKKVGNSVIVRTDDGIKMFAEGDVARRNMRIMRDGQPLDFNDLNENDRLTAVIITEKPPQMMTEQQVTATLARGGGAAPAARAPSAAAGSPTTPASTSASAAPVGGSARTLPKTASQVPLMALAGCVLLAVGGVLTLRRKLAR